MNFVYLFSLVFILLFFQSSTLPVHNRMSDNSHSFVLQKRFFGFLSGIARGLSGIFKGIKSAKSVSRTKQMIKSARMVAKSDTTRNVASIGFGAASLGYTIKSSKNKNKNATNIEKLEIESPETVDGNLNTITVIPYKAVNENK